MSYSPLTRKSKTGAQRQPARAHTRRGSDGGAHDPGLFGPKTPAQAAPSIQTKLEVGAPNDKFEREADAMADEVMRTPDASSNARSVSEDDASTESIQRECAECEAEEEDQIRRTPITGAEPPKQPTLECLQRMPAPSVQLVGVPVHGQSPGSGLPSVTPDVAAGIQNSRGRGAPLDTNTRAFMEPRFGQDFSNVRVHARSDAASLSSSLQAKAFTVSSDVFFGRGQYRPTSTRGRRLLAHELTHTVQQTGGVARQVQRQEAEDATDVAGASSGDSCAAARPPEEAWVGNETLTAIREDAPGANAHLLAPGAKGEAVELVQHALMAWGCDRVLELLPEFGADGEYGGETKAAVKAFQAETGGGLDGIVGPLTVFHLDMFLMGRSLPSGAGLIVDEDFQGDLGGERRMFRNAFIEAVRAEACAVADRMLSGTTFTFENCPGLSVLLDLLGDMDAATIEEAIVRGLGETAAKALSAKDLIDAIVGQVADSITLFLKTGADLESILEDLGAPVSVIEAAREHSAEGPEAAKKEVSSGGGASLSVTQTQARLGAGGRPLETGVRSRMEGAMGLSLGEVRIHTGPEAGGLASEMNAKAFTVGREVGFGAGEYKPGTLVGDALLAHELAHVVQQQGAGRESVSAQAGGTASGKLEQDADFFAITAVARLWGDMNGLLGDLRQNAMPRLKSGLRLSSCSSKPNITLKIPTGKIAMIVFDNLCRLAFGDPSATRGIEFNVEAEPQGRDKGTLKIVQVIEDSCRQMSIKTTSGVDEFVLKIKKKFDDKKVMESVLLDPFKPGKVKLDGEDSPSQPIGFEETTAPIFRDADKIDVEDNFRTMIIYKGESLKTIKWGWKAAADRHAPASPGCTSEWKVDPSAAPFKPQITDDDELILPTKVFKASRDATFTKGTCP